MAYSRGNFLSHLLHVIQGSGRLFSMVFASKIYKAREQAATPKQAYIIFQKADPISTKSIVDMKKEEVNSII